MKKKLFSKQQLILKALGKFLEQKEENAGKIFLLPDSFLIIKKKN